MDYHSGIYIKMPSIKIVLAGWPEISFTEARLSVNVAGMVLVSFLG